MLISLLFAVLVAVADIPANDQFYSGGQDGGGVKDGITTQTCQTQSVRFSREFGFHILTVKHITSHTLVGRCPCGFGAVPVFRFELWLLWVRLCNKNSYQSQTLMKFRTRAFNINAVADDSGIGGVDK